jgi:branched-chain amino acid transport system ATP-binding protein
MSLMADPDMLLLDEPSAGLAPNLVAKIFEHLNRLKSGEIDMVMVEQNLREVLKIAEHVFLLDQGQLEFSGGPDDLDDDDELIEMYLGDGTFCGVGSDAGVAVRIGAVNNVYTGARE